MVHRKFPRNLVAARYGRPKMPRKAYRFKKGAKVVRIAGNRDNWIAPRVSTKLVYEQAQTTTATSGITTDYLFNLNSIYDPDRSGTGTQPLGHDQLASLYGRYIVKKAKVTITGHKSSDNVVCAMALHANNDSSSYSAVLMNTLKMQPDTVTRYSNLYSANEKPMRISRTYDLAKITGVSYTKYMSDDRYQSPFNQSPTETIIAHLVVGDILATTTAVIIANVRIEYFIECFDPVDIGPS